MESGISRLFLRIFAAAVIVSFAAIGIAAQDEEDGDPNSPTPILISMKDNAARALAAPLNENSRKGASKSRTEAFEPGSQVVLYVSHLTLMPGEGANAFRVYVEDAKGRSYRFPVVDLQPYAGSDLPRYTYELTVQLSDEIGFWDAMGEGDVLIQIGWRGLGSNRLRLGYGQTGGKIKDDPPFVDQVAAFAKDMSKDGKKAPVAGKTNSPDFVGYKWSGDRSRLLEQATFGPTAALDSRIRRIGLKTWLAEQFAATYPSQSANCATYPTISNSLAYPCQPLKPANQGSDTLCDGGADDVPVTCVRDTYTMYPIQTWFQRYAFYGDAQLRHRVAWALQQVLVTSGVDVQQSRHMVEYNKILSNNAFGNFRDILGPRNFTVPTATAGILTTNNSGITLNPAMGDYLSMALSTKNSPNENYAREIMQLFSVGLFMLNQDGTLQKDGQGNLIPTYDQNTVNNLTKVFTGWTFCQNAASCPNVAVGTVNYIDPMLINTNNHDITAKTLLSYPGSTTTNIAACPTTGSTSCVVTTGVNAAQAAVNISNYADASMVQALDNIFNHPNVGPFISKTLIQHLVTSDPTPAYVGRVAAVFNNNGQGVRGDLKAVVRAILLDPEARGEIKTDPFYGKLREPEQLVTNFLRAFNVRSADGLSTSDGFLTGRGEFTGMAQIPFLSPTVFNYYPPDYTVPGTTMLGPEFAIQTTGTSIQRANFMNRFVFTAPAIAGATTDSPNGTAVDFSDLQALSASDSTGNLLLDELNRRMLHSTMSSSMRSSILPVVTGVSAADTLGRVRQAVYLIATSSQYQVQR